MIKGGGNEWSDGETRIERSTWFWRGEQMARTDGSAREILFDGSLNRTERSFGRPYSAPSPC